MRRGLIIGTIGATIAGAAPAADWTVTPYIGLQEILTDNAFGGTSGSGPKRADAITQLAPGVGIQAIGSRINLGFNYNPTLSAYAAYPSQDRIDQSLSGNGQWTIVTNRVDMQFNAFASENSGNGSYVTPAAGGLVPLNDRVLNYGGSIAPHFQERFGDLATLDAYYRVSSSNTSAQNGVQAAAGLSNNLLVREPQLVIGSGDSFGRLTSQLTFDHTDGSGSGPNNVFADDTDRLNLQYHVTHAFAATGSVGYQRIHYDRSATSLGYNNEGITWSIGFRETPNDTTQLSVSYGRQQGSDDVDASLSYDLAPRTFIRGSYTVQVETQLQSILNNLQFLSRDQSGNPIDSRTGLPFSATNQLFGQQNTLFRDKLANLALSHSFTRSSMTVSLNYEERQPLDGPPSTSDGWGARIGYSQELTPYLQGSVDAGYGDSSQPTGTAAAVGNFSSKYVNADASLSYAINETLSGNVVYSFFRRISPVPGFGQSTNTLMFGLRKSF